MITYTKEKNFLNNKTVWIIVLDNYFNSNYTLLLSKVSEAINPNIKNNHIGEGATLNQFLEKQKGVKFIINGGFNHYKKNFYNWKNQDFNVGDPVGLVKIREHYFEDYLTINNYGFLVQDKKNESWKILDYKNITKKEKYILGCTPLLITNNIKTDLSKENMNSVKSGEINPPSFLGHGLQNHPRTAIGIKDDKLYFVIVEENEKSDGCTLLELQNIGIELKLNSFLNLDGGGSTQFKLFDNGKWVSNEIRESDKERILGNVIVLFDENLK